MQPIGEEAWLVRLPDERELGYMRRSADPPLRVGQPITTVERIDVVIDEIGPRQLAGGKPGVLLAHLAPDSR